MIDRFELYLPKCKKHVKIHVSIPKKYHSMGITFDTLYMLDGQNMFKDEEASFGRSLKMGQYLSILGKKFDRRICGVAIYNAESDLGRLNEYTPWRVLDQYLINEWAMQDTKVCENYSYDLINTVVPYIQSKYPVSKKPSHTFIYGSSLGGFYSAYLVNKYPNTFGGAGIFSQCAFLCGNKLFEFLETNLNKKARNFIYVGASENSDGEFNEELYLSSSKELHNFYKSHGVTSRLQISYYGIHNEANWENHILSFISFMYSDDIELTV